MQDRFEKQRQVLIQTTFSGVFAALVAVSTLLVQIPNPSTRGYVNFGDLMIFTGALIFGPIVGGFAGSVGSSIADVVSGYAYYAPFTFVIKGIEGALAGLISNRKSVRRDVIAVVLGGAEMVTGYFLAEFFLPPLQLGWAALTEVPGNIFQVVGGLFAVPIASVIHIVLPLLWKRTNHIVLPLLWKRTKNRNSH